MAPTIYSYVVVLQYWKGDKTEEHTVATEAYSLTDAMMQAHLEIDVKHDLSKNGYEFKVLSVKPDTTKARQQTADLIAELAQYLPGKKLGERR